MAQLKSGASNPDARLPWRRKLLVPLLLLVLQLLLGPQLVLVPQLLLGPLCFNQAAAAVPEAQPAIDVIQYPPWSLVTALAWSEDGNWLAVAAGNQILLYQMPGITLARSARVEALTPALAFSPDGRRLAAGSHDGLIRLWPMPTSLGQEAAAFPQPQEIAAHTKGVNALAFHPSGGLLASGGYDAVARIWNPESGALVKEIIGGTYSVPALAFFPGEDGLAVVNGEVLRRRDALSGSILGTIKSTHPLYCVAIRRDGLRLASGDTQNGIQIWDPGQMFRSGMDEYPQPLAQFSMDGKANSFRTLVWALAFSPDGAWLAAAGGDGSVRLWQGEGGSTPQVFPGHTGGATSLAFSPDGCWLASGGLDAAVRFWKLSGCRAAD